MTRPILILAAVVLVVAPAVAVWLDRSPTPVVPAFERLSPTAPSPLPARALFDVNQTDVQADPAFGAPRLVGIVGRLPHDAVALLETDDGPARGIAVGEAIGGWQVMEITRDRVRLVRDGREHVAILPPSVDAQ